MQTLALLRLQPSHPRPVTFVPCLKVFVLRRLLKELDRSRESRHTRLEARRSVVLMKFPVVIDYFAVACLGPGGGPGLLAIRALIEEFVPLIGCGGRQLWRSQSTRWYDCIRWQLQFLRALPAASLMRRLLWSSLMALLLSLHVLGFRALLTELLRASIAPEFLPRFGLRRALWHLLRRLWSCLALGSGRRRLL